MKVKNLTQTEFIRLVGDFKQGAMQFSFVGERPCIVDFWASWCGYCRRLDPLMEEMAEKFAGQIDFYRVDVEAEEELDQAFDIQTIPMLLLCVPGKEHRMELGVMGRKAFIELLEELINN